MSKVETVKKEGKKGATKRVKYGIKGADHFLSLTDFVEFHKKNDLADKTQTTFRLREVLLHWYNPHMNAKGL